MYKFQKSDQCNCVQCGGTSKSHANSLGRSTHSQGRDTGQLRNDLLVDVDAFEEDFLVQKLVVVVQQDRRVIHGREADGWVPRLKNVANIK